MEFLCTNQTEKRKTHWTGVVSYVVSCSLTRFELPSLLLELFSNKFLLKNIDLIQVCFNMYSRW